MTDGLGRGIKAWDLWSNGVEGIGGCFGVGAGVLGSIGVSVPSWLDVVVFRSWGIIVFSG